MPAPLDPLTIEAAASDSWRRLFHGRPDKDLNLVLRAAPEIYAQHKRNVEALLTNALDPNKALLSLTQGRQGLDDCTPDARSFHTRLAAYLKEWAKVKLRDR
jgi:hypothetical protein